MSTKKFDVSGFLCFNPQLNKMLLVKGRRALKWGPPKGHLEKGETELQTAVCELFEETGITINMVVNCLPSVAANSVKLFLLIVSDQQQLSIKDTKEIMMIQWFDFNTIRTMMNDDKNAFNGCIRHLFKNPTYLDSLTKKLSSYQNNYKHQQAINGELFKIINTHRKNDVSANEQQLNDNINDCYNDIQNKYNNIFFRNDLIHVIEMLFT